MNAEEELRNLEGGSVLIIRIVAGQSEHLEVQDLIAARLQRYSYAPRPFAAILIDLSLGGYSISAYDLTTIVMSLPAGSAERMACAVVATEEYAARLQQLLKITKLVSFVRVFSSLEDALNAVSIWVSNRGPGLPALFVQSSRAAVGSSVGRVPVAGPAPMPEPATAPAPSSTEIAHPIVFLAHASEDKERVRRLHRQLTDCGVQPWLDEVDLIPGQNWPVAIADAIKRCDVFLACLSKSAVSKQGYVHRELRMALSAYGDRPAGTIFLIPVKLDDCEVPDLQIPEIGIRLRDIQWLDLWKADGFEGLVNAIRTAGATPKPQPRASRRGVRIVDISFLERISETKRRFPAYVEGSGDGVRIEVKVRNIEPEVAFIKRLAIAVEQVLALQEFAFTGAAVPVSAEYDMALPIKLPPFRVEMPIAHSLEPNGVDRFVVTIHPERSAHVFVARLEILYDEDDKSTVSERILFATRGGAYTWPTASVETLAEIDSIAAAAGPGMMWERWPVARPRIESNNQIRDALSHIPGTRNRAVASFEMGEPLIEGF